MIQGLSTANALLLRQVLASAALAVLAYLLVSRVRFTRPAARRLSEFAGLEEGGEAVPVGSRAHQIRLALSGWGLPVEGREEQVLLLLKVLAGLVAAALILALRLPPLTALAGPVLAWLAVDGLVEGRWKRMVHEIEREVPTFLARLSATVQVEPNVLLAVSDIGETLDPEKPLRAWTERFVARCQTAGRRGFQEMLEEAQAISPSLGLAVFEIGRLWQTGGPGYARAFARAAENLSGILQGRALAASKAAGIRSSIRMVLLALVGVVLVMLRSPQFAAAMRDPLVQVVYLGMLLWVGFGWYFINGMVEEAL